MNNSSAARRRRISRPPDKTPWIQLVVGVICMIATANIRYAWTLFVH